MFLLMFGTAGINTFMAAYALGRGIGGSGLFYVASGLMLAVSRLTAGRLGPRAGDRTARPWADRRLVVPEPPRAGCSPARPTGWGWRPPSPVVDPKKAPMWAAAQAGYGEVVVATKTYLSGHASAAKKFVAAVQQANGYLATHQGDPTVLSVARKVQSGVPDPVLQSSVALVEWPKSGAMDDAGWTKTLAFVNSLGALPDGAKVTSDNWTNTYLPADGQS
ncbi:hypothetical protein GCM10009527_030510 [Actinomadura nitritigenes]